MRGEKGRRRFSVQWPCVFGLLLVAGFFSIWQPGAVQAAEGGYAGADVCAGCHEELAANFAKTAHGKKADSRTPAAQHGCESCHGPMASHVEAGGGKETARRLGKDTNLSVHEINATCLECHQKGKVVLWDSSTHAAKELTCTNCHSIHHGHEKLLVKADEKEVCFQCHGTIRAQIQRTSHHPIREGKITCTNCHNPHGSVAPKQIDAATINDKCFECHAEKRGPFLWEHRPAVEDCTNCHTPHGSSYGKLLAKRVPYLCQSCHSQAHHPGTIYAVDPTAGGTNTYENLLNQSKERGLYRACLNCHQYIHGSNHPSGKTFLR
jgi:DmsE family decaheme c-type cytochrome